MISIIYTETISRKGLPMELTDRRSGCLSETQYILIMPVIFQKMRKLLVLSRTKTVMSWWPIFQDP